MKRAWDVERCVGLTESAKKKMVANKQLADEKNDDLAVKIFAAKRVQAVLDEAPAKRQRKAKEQAKEREAAAALPHA